MVVDSTVRISALHFGGTPRHALDEAVKRYALATSEYIRAEVERKLILKFGWTIARVRSRMFEFVGAAADILPVAGLVGVSRDPKDDAILACAVAAGAQMVITGDRDLLVLDSYAGIDIVTPRQFLDRMKFTSLRDGR